MAEFAFRGRERELLTWFFWHGSCNPAAIIPAHLDEYVDQIAKPGALRAGIEYYAAVWQDIEINKKNMQRKLAIPVLGVGGRSNAGEIVGKALTIVAERVSTAVVEGAGHWVSDENPGELSRILLEFLAEAQQTFEVKNPSTDYYCGGFGDLLSKTPQLNLAELARADRTIAAAAAA